MSAPPSPFNVAVNTNGQVRIITANSANDAVNQMMHILSPLLGRDETPPPPLEPILADPWQRMSPVLQSALRELIATAPRDEWRKALGEFLASKSSEERRHVWAVLSSPEYIATHCDLVVAATHPPGASDHELQANEKGRAYGFIERMVELRPQLARDLSRPDTLSILRVFMGDSVQYGNMAFMLVRQQPLRFWLPDEMTFVHDAAVFLSDLHTRVRFIGCILGGDYSLPIPSDLNTTTNEHTGNLIHFLVTTCFREDQRRRILRVVLSNWNDVQVHALSTTIFSTDEQEEISEMLSFHNHSRQERNKRQQLVRDQETKASTVVDKPEHDRASGRQCVACFTNLACVVMGPCGHAHYCRGCWEKAPSDSRQRCPTCKTTITQVIYAVMDASPLPSLTLVEPPPRVPTPMVD